MSQTSFKKIAEDKIQPKEFAFDSENMLLVKKILKIYPKNYKESSIMPLLSIAQIQNNGWLPKKAKEVINFIKKDKIIDGHGKKIPHNLEMHERKFRADSIDGLRPIKKYRK